MLSAGGDIHYLYFAALVGKVCLVQLLQQAVDESEGFLVVIEILFSFPFSFL